MRVLFTAVGGSDPIKRQLDGPMLHSVRVYKPDIVYMYLTKRMCEYENIDSRYSWAVEKLADRLGIDIKLIKIERENMTEVHLFDTFYKDFEDILGEILKENEDAELFVNASSGTPAIKSALVTIAAMSIRPINVIQVSSGELAPLHDRDDDNKYDKDLQWEFNIDNNDDFKDRTIIIKNNNFLVKIEKNNIEKYISTYDYPAAFDVARKIRESISQEAFCLISAAYCRLLLNGKETDRNLKDTNIDIIPQKTSGKRELVEYILWLDITQKKGDYLSFIRGITPIAYELMMWATEKILDNSIENYFEKRGNNKYLILREKLETTEMGTKILNSLDIAYNGNFKDNFCGTDQLEIIINSFFRK